MRRSATAAPETSPRFRSPTATLTETASGFDAAAGAESAFPANPTEAINAKLVRRVLANIRGLLVELDAEKPAPNKALRDARWPPSDRTPTRSFADELPMRRGLTRPLNAPGAQPHRGR